MKRIIPWLVSLLVSMAPACAFAQTKPLVIVNGQTRQLADSDTLTAPKLSISATNATNSRLEQDRASDWLNVLDYGVKGIGCGYDDGPAIRAIFAGAINNKTIFFPPNLNYCFKTNVPPGSYPNSDPTGVMISQKSNFHVIAHGATFTTHSSIPLTAIVTFDRATDWTWDGGSFVGNRTGLGAGEENVGMMLLNINRFRISDTNFTGYGGNGAAFAGDWIIAGEISRQKMNGVGICFDIAFLKSVTIRDVVATGADTNGASGPSQLGNKCVSIIHDTPLAGYNLSGVSFYETIGVTVENVDASNFYTAIAAASGSKIRFINNYLHDNPGAGGVGGVGYYLFYANGGPFPSTGAPLSDVQVMGGQVSNNGSTTAGYGMLIDASTITNSDLMTGFSVTGVQFTNNASVGLLAQGAALSNVSINGNVYSGAAQTTSSVTTTSSTDAGTHPWGLDLTGSYTQGGLRTSSVVSVELRSSASDLAYRWRNQTPVSGTAAYDWSYAASNSTGSLYLNDVRNGKFPFLISPNAASAITLGTDVVVSGGAVNAPSYKVGGTVGVSCAAGTFNATTAVVTNGIVTHC